MSQSQHNKSEEPRKPFTEKRLAQWREYQARRKLKNPEAVKQSAARARKNYRARHPERSRAHEIVSNAIKVGTLTKKPCEFCGAIKVEAHHDDYTKPLQVRWLCKKHHFAVHKAARYAA